jgi:hypothetical protein
MWSLTLRRIFGCETEEKVGGWIRLYNEKLHDLYSLLSIIKYYEGDQSKEDELDGSYSTHCENEKFIQNLK